MSSWLGPLRPNILIGGNLGPLKPQKAPRVYDLVNMVQFQGFVEAELPLARTSTQTSNQVSRVYCFVINPIVVQITVGTLWNTRQRAGCCSNSELFYM